MIYFCDQVINLPKDNTEGKFKKSLAEEIFQYVFKRTSQNFPAREKKLF